MMRVRPCGRMLAGMNILPIPRILVVALAALAVTAAAVIASPSEASHYGAKQFTLTGKALAFEQVDAGEPGPSLGDRQIITEDVYRGGKRVGTSDIECTVVRIAPKSAVQCFNTTSLPEGQITAQGMVTSDQEEQVPFQQAITGGTGAYAAAGGVLTVDEAGDKPAELRFELTR